MGIVQQIRDRLGYVDFSAPADKSTSAPPESKGLPQLIGGTPLDFGRVWLGQSLEVDELTRYTAYAYSVYAYAAMQYRAAKIAEPPLWVAQETDEGEEWIRDHDLQLLLEEPNPDMDMGQLRALTSMYLDIDGEALWHKVRDNGGRVRMLYPYSRSQFDVQPGEVDGVSRIWGKFTISHASGSRVYDANDVVYFRDASPTIGQQVTSRLDAALNWANIGQRTEVALKEALRRGVMPFAVFSYPPDYNPDEETRQKNRETLETRYGGAENHGRPLMLYGGLTAQFANVDLSALLPEPVLDRVEANVALALGVRPEVLGYLVGLKNSPWSHMDTARKITYEDTIEPYWRREEKALTRQLLPLPERQARRFIRVDCVGGPGAPGRRDGAEGAHCQSHEPLTSGREDERPDLHRQGAAPGRTRDRGRGGSGGAQRRSGDSRNRGAAPPTYRRGGRADQPPCGGGASGRHRDRPATRAREHGGSVARAG
jgi:HK97 family phage portal protein